MAIHGETGSQPAAQPSDEGNRTKVHPGFRRKARRVAFFTRDTAYGGLQKHLIELILRLDTSRVHPLILSIGEDRYTEHLNQRYNRQVEIRAGLKQVPDVQGVFAGQRPHASLDSLWDGLRLWRVFRRSKADVLVFVHDNFTAFPWYAYLAARLAGVPRLYSVQHLIPPPAPEPLQGYSILNLMRRVAGWRVRTMLRMRLPGLMSDKTICVSNAIRNELVNGYLYPADRTITIYNGVDLSEYSPCRSNFDSVRRELGLGPDEIVLVCVARLSYEKGIDILLKALARLVQEGRSFKCIIIGEGPSRDKLVEQARDLGLSSRVFFVGFKKDVRPYLQAANIFVLTSRREGFPISILEAMACGLPCVVTAVAGNAEAVGHNREGLIVSVRGSLTLSGLHGSPEETSSALSYLLDHKDEREQMSRRARARVEELFDLEDCMEKMKAVILS